MRCCTVAPGSSRPWTIQSGGLINTRSDAEWMILKKQGLHHLPPEKFVFNYKISRQYWAKSAPRPSVSSYCICLTFISPNKQQVGNRRWENLCFSILYKTFFLPFNFQHISCYFQFVSLIEGLMCHNLRIFIIHVNVYSSPSLLWWSYELELIRTFGEVLQYKIAFEYVISQPILWLQIETTAGIF